MASIIENLNSVITTKNQLNTILKENGQPGSEVFSEYPEQFRAAIAGAGTSEDEFNTYISSYLDTYNFIDADELSAMGYITASDIPEVDLSSYVTKTELSNAGYITIADIPSVDLSSYVTYDYLSAQGYLTSHQSLADYPTYSYVSDNYVSLHGDRVMDGTLTLGNTVPAIIGTQRAWRIFEDGSGSGAYVALQNTVNSKSFFVRSESGNNLVQIHAAGATNSKHTLTSSLQGSYVNCYHYVKGIGNYTANNDAVPGTNDVASVFNNTYAYIMSCISSSGGTTSGVGIHYGTAVHDRTSYTVTATVDTFETDTNGDPLVGTFIGVKVTSVTGTNPSTLYPIKFIVNGKENPRWYANAAVDANGRNWYRDMNEANRYYYWFWDGSYWVWQGLSEERDSQYSAMTDSEAYNGTSTTARLIKPVTLATYYVAKSCFTFDSTTNTLTITVS